MVGRLIWLEAIGDPWVAGEYSVSSVRGLFVTEEFDLQMPAEPGVLAQEQAGSGRSLRLTIEAMHLDAVNKNYRYYPEDEVRKALSTWTRPYARPVLPHHDMYADPLGRVVSAKIGPSLVASDAKAVFLEAEITDPTAIEKVQDRRYSTVSIGAIVRSATCSICGKDQVEGFCEHERGKKYKNKLAYWEMRDIDFLEVSFVNAPADVHAQVVSVGEGAAAGGGGDAVQAPEDASLEASPESLVEAMDQLAGVVVQDAEGSESDEPTDESPSSGADGAAADEPISDQTYILEALAAVHGEVRAIGERLQQLEQRLEALEKTVAEKGEAETLWLKQSIDLAKLARRYLAERWAEHRILYDGADPETFDALIDEALKTPAAKLLADLRTARPKRVERIEPVESPALASKGVGDASESDITDKPVDEGKRRKISIRELDAHIEKRLKGKE